MGSILFKEIKDFRKQQTAFTVHPKPLAIDSLNNTDKQYVSEFISPALYYKINSGGKHNVIALLDTGVYAEHKALQNKVIASMMYDGSTKGPNGKLTDEHGHGTHLAGILVADHITISYNIDGNTKTEKIGGMIPDARLVSIRVTADNSGSTSWYAIAEGLEQVFNYNLKPGMKEDDKIKIVVLAYNAFDNVNTDYPVCNHRINKLIQGLYKLGIAVVVSAGNAYEYYQPTFTKSIASGLAYPAYFKNILVAMANDSDNKLASFTQRNCDEDHDFGNHVFSAVGADTISTGIGAVDAVSVLSGSSQAAAVLAGLYIQKLIHISAGTSNLHPSQIFFELNQNATLQNQNMFDASRTTHVKHFKIANL
jgi:subtilisin family serine protease